MKLIQGSFFRALCALIAGVLIVKYRQEMVTWLTIGVGVLFFVSGVISCIAYYVQRNHALKLKAQGVTLFDAQGNPVSQGMPTFPIVGIGSLVLGVILAMMPATFITGLTYIFAVMILLGAVNQMAELILARKYGHVAWEYWIMPLLMFLAAIVALVRPSVIASAPLFFIGWCMICYGVVEIINGIKLHRVRKAAENAANDSLSVIPQTDDDNSN